MIKYLFFLLIILASCTEKNTSDFNTIKGDKFYSEGENLLLKDNIEAYRKFQAAINYYSKTKDSSNISKSLICQSIAQKYSGDVNGAEATLVEALKMMKPDDESLYSVYGNLGDLKYEQKEYAEATDWYNKALDEKNYSQETKFNILTNKAAADFRQKRYDLALKTLESIDLAKIEDLKLKFRIQENMEYIKWLADNSYPAEKTVKNLLQQKISAEDYWGMNSSYAHLAEFYQTSDPQSSLFYARQMLSVAERNKSPEDRLEALSRIMLVDEPTNIKKTFEDYKKLSDSIQNSRNNFNTKFAYIKYDSKNKELENQKFKTKSLEDENKIIILLVILVFLVLAVFFLQKRQIQLKKEKELEVKNTELKYSKKVHDVVANGIYHVMTKLENQKDFVKEQLLDELEFVYEKSRDISYDKPYSEQNSETFSETISQLIASFKNENLKTFTVGNEDSVWENIAQPIRDDVYQIIREFLVNMKKHSKAGKVVLKFERINETVAIQYSDDGIGLAEELQLKNGITNTVYRTKLINGTIIFDKETDKGLKINLSFPVSQNI